MYTAVLIVNGGFKFQYSRNSLPRIYSIRLSSMSTINYWSYVYIALI